jgi:hypothetical protein
MCAVKFWDLHAVETAPIFLAIHHTFYINIEISVYCPEGLQQLCYTCLILFGEYWLNLYIFFRTKLRSSKCYPSFIAVQALNFNLCATLHFLFLSH